MMAFLLVWATLWVAITSAASIGIHSRPHFGLQRTNQRPRSSWDILKKTDFQRRVTFRRRASDEYPSIDDGDGDVVEERGNNNDQDPDPHHHHYGMHLLESDLPLTQHRLDLRERPTDASSLSSSFMSSLMQSAPDTVMPITRQILYTATTPAPNPLWISRRLNLPPYLLDQLLDYFRLSSLAKHRSLVTKNKNDLYSAYFRPSRYDTVDLVGNDRTDFHGLIAAGRYADLIGDDSNAVKQNADQSVSFGSMDYMSDGDQDLAIVFPGTKSLKNLNLDFQLRLVPSDLFSEQPYSSYSPLSSGEYTAQNFEGTLESEDAMAWWSVYLPTFFDPSPPTCERIPAGFRTAFESIRFPMAQKLLDFIRSDPRGIKRFKTITFFGFSLGGAVATYASVFLTKLLEQEGMIPPVSQSSHDATLNTPRIRIITVGAPKSGDLCFQQQFAEYFGWTTEDQIRNSRHLSLQLMHPDDPVARGSVFDFEILGRKRYRHIPGYFITLKPSERIFDWLRHRHDLYEHGYYEWVKSVVLPASRDLVPMLDLRKGFSSPPDSDDDSFD